MERYEYENSMRALAQTKYVESLEKLAQLVVATPFIDGMPITTGDIDKLVRIVEEIRKNKKNVENA